MNRRRSKFLRLLALGTVLAAAFSAAAQQQILFSKPAETPADKANSFMLEPTSKLQGRAGEFNAPKQLFNIGAEPELPPPMPIIPSQSLKDALNRRKNWTLMTPEEILGVPTAEKILGLPDPTGNDKRTPEERYLRRQNLAAANLSATNALRRGDASLLRNDANLLTPRDQRDQPGQLDASAQFARPDQRSDMASRKYFDRLVAAPTEAPFGASQNADSTWGNAFSQPAPLPKPNPEQIAAHDRYAAFLNQLSAQPEKTTVPTRFSTGTVPTTDPNLQRTPLFNPLGQSYVPLQSGISRPTGITPLPSLTSPKLQPVAPKKSLADLPPWLSKEPQPLNSPFNTRTW